MRLRRLMRNEEQSSAQTWRREVLTELLNRNILLTEFADAKAGALLVFAVIIIGGVIEPVVDAAVEVVGAIRSDPSPQTIGTAAAMCLLTAWTTWYAGRVVMTTIQTVTPQMRPPDATTDNLLFFDDIAVTPRQEWLSKIERASSGELENDLAEQAHTVARIADDKHRKIRRASQELATRALPGALLLYAFSHAIT
jgi:Family of unknown function (DUF5706)